MGKIAAVTLTDDQVDVLIRYANEHRRAEFFHSQNPRNGTVSIRGVAETLLNGVISKIQREQHTADLTKTRAVPRNRLEAELAKRDLEEWED